MKAQRERRKTMRRKAGFTALELAEQIGMSESRVYAIERERSRPTRSEASKWAKAIGADPDQLFSAIRKGGEI